MFVVYRGGVPVVFNVTLAKDEVRKHTVENSAGTIHLWLRVSGKAARVYFNEADKTSDINYVTVDPSVNEGIFSIPADIKDIWFKGVDTSSVIEMVALKARG